MNGERYSVDGDQAEDETLKIALAAYENARMDGLCHEGAWECALDAVRSLSPDAFNYTQWRQNLFAALSEEELSR